MQPVIRFENVGKLYRLGTVGTGTISHDLRRWWITNVMRKEDPYLKIGESNDRSTKGSSDYVYALKDINLEVQEGDVLGIIGKNGAGKSTLLKLLSRVTAPTTGKIYTKGRIASLLEVGTGFHPELTGRENIYMNGSILGMKKYEIDRKLDEIIDFSGCERYIDTPVKRYSSGMMVRLGFAVAAHLDPEILVVDEVLAVGDAEFQKKAIGKMQDVSKGQGRTVLFVSHNMGSISNLCKRCILLKNGSVFLDSKTENVIKCYLQNEDSTSHKVCYIKDRITYMDPIINIQEIEINNTTLSETTIVTNQKNLHIKIQGELTIATKMDVILTLLTPERIPLASYAESVYLQDVAYFQQGEFTIAKDIIIPEFVGQGETVADIRLFIPRAQNLMIANNCIKIRFEGNMAQYCRPLKIEKEGFFGLEKQSFK